MKRILYLIPLMLPAACRDDAPQPQNFEPQLHLYPAQEVTRTTALLKGSVTLRGNTAMPRLCMQWGTDSTAMQVGEPLQPDGDTVRLRLQALTPGATYYYRMQANDGAVCLSTGIQYFTTMPNEKPTMGEAQMVAVGPLSAVVGYALMDDGGEPLTGAGCILQDLTTQQKDTFALAAEELSSGTYRQRLEHLQPNTAYRVCAYAATTAGGHVGAPVEFITTDVVSLPEPGMLPMLLGDTWSHIGRLSMQAPLDGSDMALLRIMAGGTDADGMSGRLQHLDLTESSIVEGGAPYDGQHFTVQNMIGQGMFAGCAVMQWLALPANVTHMEHEALKDCAALQYLTLPHDLTNLLPSTGCMELRDIRGLQGSAYYTCRDGVVLNAACTEICWYPMAKEGYYTLPVSITSLGDYAFRGCHLSSITIPEGLKELGQGAFADSWLVQAVLPATLYALPTGCFQGCLRMTSLHLGCNTELLGDYALDGCPLKELVIESEIPPICETNAFGNDSEALFAACTLYVPRTSLSIYRNHRTWKRFHAIKSIQ